MDAPKHNLRWCMITQQTSKYMIESRYLGEHAKEEPTCFMHCMFQHSFMHICMCTYFQSSHLSYHILPMHLHPHENFNAPFCIPFAYPPFHISLHPLVHPVHICLIWFIAPLSNTFNDVNTGCTKRRAHPGSHIWLRFCQSLAEFCSYTCCSHSCAYFLRYSGRSIGQLASDSAGVGRTWLSKHCLVYSIWIFLHV